MAFVLCSSPIPLLFVLDIVFFVSVALSGGHGRSRHREVRAARIEIVSLYRRHIGSLRGGYHLKWLLVLVFFGCCIHFWNDLILQLVLQFLCSSQYFLLEKSVFL